MASDQTAGAEILPTPMRIPAARHCQHVHRDPLTHQAERYQSARGLAYVRFTGRNTGSL